MGKLRNVNVMFLLQTPGNANCNAESDVPRQSHVCYIVQGIIEGHVSYILINKEAAVAKLHRVAKQCDDVGVPQARCSPNHIQE